MYNYKAKVLSVYDADTITLLIDVGFNIHIKEKCRVYGIDTPELRTKNKKEKELGYKARDFVRDFILDKEVLVETYKDEKKGKFGRYLVNIILDDGLNLSSLLISKGFAHKYFGGRKKGWFNE